MRNTQNREEKEKKPLGRETRIFNCVADVSSWCYSLYLLYLKYFIVELKKFKTSRSQLARENYGCVTKHLEGNLAILLVF